MNIRFFAILLLFLFCIPVKGEVTGEWVLHPSADLYSYTGLSNGYNNCLKILDGERYTYFLVTAFPHLAPNKDYCQTEAMLYRHDKRDGAGSGRLEPLSHLEQTSGMLVECAAYSPEGKYLAVVYQGGAIDIYPDSGGVRTCTGLRDLRYPGDLSANTITADIDGRRFYVATAFGYLTVDSETGKITELNILNRNIDYACRVGGRMVLCDKDKAYSFEIGNCPAADEELPVLECVEGSPSKYLNSDNTLRNPDSLSPLTDNSFLYLTHSASDEMVGPYVNVAVFEGDKVRIANLSEETLNYNGYGYNRNGRFDYLNEGVITPAQTGYMVNRTESILLVRKGVDADISTSGGIEDFRSRGVERIAKTDFATLSSSGNASEKSVAMGSYDGKTYWLYYPLQGFVRRSVNVEGDKAVWSKAGDALVPDAANSFRVSYMAYHPRYGVLVRNNSIDQYYDIYNNNADGLSGYKSGKWTYYGLPKHNYAKRGVNPVPRGIGVDPENPQYIWSGSRDYGVTRLNMDDPTDILHLTRPNASDINSPGCYAVHDVFSSWSALSCFSPVVFDSDGTMWMQFCDWNRAFTGGVCSLWYMTSADRAASANASRDKSAFIMPKRVEFPLDGNPLYMQVWPMSLPANKNLIGVSAGHYIDSAILDHNGTLEDTSDDRVAYLTDIYDSAGNLMKLSRGVYMFEDPYDGALLISYSQGVLVTSREKLFTSGTKQGDFLEVETEVGGSQGHQIAQCDVTGIAVDGENRKWIATMEDGVYCLSEDRKSLLAHFVKEDGGLPSSTCLSCVYNPETNSLWVGTDKGIAEFVFSGGELPDYISCGVEIFPMVVEPDYYGYIDVSGLMDSRTYELKDEKGNPVLSLRSVEGKTQMDVRELSSGEYGLYDGEKKVGALVILRN